MLTPALRWLRLLSVASGCALMAWACGTTSPSSSGPSSVSGVVAGATGLGSTPTTGSVQSGTAPGATAGGPVTSASSGSSAASGGGDEVSVSAGGAPFQTVLVSAGTSGSGAAVFGKGAGLARVETVAPGFIQISLPSAVTSLAIGLTYASNLPSGGFDLLIQVANGSSVGPVATVHKSVTTSNFVDVSGIVFATSTPRTSGPSLPTNPLSGAVVSTSLDSQTAKTDVSGGFHLQTSTGAASGNQCYTITITFPGIPTYSARALWGAHVTNLIFVMSPPSPGSVPSCGSS